MRRWWASGGLVLVLAAPALAWGQSGALELLSHPGTRRLLGVLQEAPRGGLALSASYEALIAQNGLRSDEAVTALLRGIEDGSVVIPEGLDHEHPRLAALLVQVAVGQPARWSRVEAAGTSAKDRLTAGCDGPQPPWVIALRDGIARGAGAQTFESRKGLVQGGTYEQTGHFQRYAPIGRLESEADLAERTEGAPFDGHLTWRVTDLYERPSPTGGAPWELLEVEIEAAAATGEILYRDTVRFISLGSDEWYSTGDFQADRVSGAHTFNAKIGFDETGQFRSGFFEVGVNEIIENFQPTLRFTPNPRAK